MPEQQGDFPEPPDYDAIEERGWKENAGRVLDELSSGDPYMSRRIETFSVRFGYGRDEIVAKIASDEMFAAHKFTKEGGGGQDNQFLEVRNLLEIFQKGSEGDDIVLLVIVDGPYFTEAKMNDLHRFERISPPMSKALSIGEVPAFLEEL